MTWGRALVSGLAGAAVLNVAHETARQFIPHAPRVEVIGMRAIARPMRALGKEPPPHDQLYWLTLAGDLVSNGVYYSAVGLGEPEGATRRGLLLGLVAGLGGAFLPPYLGLGTQPGEQFPQTHLMTTAWYTLGGVVAGAVYERIGE